MSYGYDDASRLTGITQGAASVGFTFDAANRRATLTLPNGIVATYGYDDASQLTSITYRQGTTVVGDLVYGYDLMGNRTSVSGSLARTNLPAATTANGVYNSANQLANWNGATVSYDNNGNMLTDGTRTYSWDARNRLVGIAGPVTASFQYDALGRRAQKTVSGTRTNYFYDGANPVQELNGTTPTANILTGFGMDEFYRRTDSVGSRDMLTDALGTVLALTDSTGAVQTSYTYDPFGNTTVSGQASSNPFQYTGRENDGTGLYYYRARYYSPTMQRFVTSDPIGLKGGMNTYAYVGGNPLNWTDALGLRKDFVWIDFGNGSSPNEFGGYAYSSDAYTGESSSTFVASTFPDNGGECATIESGRYDYVAEYDPIRESIVLRLYLNGSGNIPVVNGVNPNRTSSAPAGYANDVLAHALFGRAYTDRPGKGSCGCIGVKTDRVSRAFQEFVKGVSKGDRGTVWVIRP